MFVPKYAVKSSPLRKEIIQMNILLLTGPTITAIDNTFNYWELVTSLENIVYYEIISCECQ